MYRIYKYTLDVADKQQRHMPFGAEILSVAEQFDSIVVYALVKTDEPHIDDCFEFYIHGTGHEVPKGETSAKFLGTVKLMTGVLMFHVFYKKV